MPDGADRGGPDDAEPSQYSAEARKDLLDARVRELTRENRASLRSQDDFDAVLVRGKPTNHLVMFVILACVMAAAAVSGRILGDVGGGALAAIVFGGLFGLLWLVLTLTAGEEIERLSIDQRGVISSVKSGRSVDARGDFVKVAAPSAVLLICAFLTFSLTRDIVNPPPPNCSDNPRAVKDSDFSIALPNLGNLLGGASASPGSSAPASPATSASPVASASPGASGTADGSSASAGTSGWTVGSEKLVERLVRSLQLLVVIVAAVVAAVFLGMMLGGEWVFGIRPVRRKRGGS
jgi:hypothetical protein